MDNIRGQDSISDELGVDDAYDYGAIEAPPSIDVEERRMHVRAYNYWVSLLGSSALPSIEDLNPEDTGDFSANSVLLDFSMGMENPAIIYLGSALREECDIDNSVERVDQVPPRSLLSRLTDHYLQIIANAAPVGFEAEFTNQRNVEIMYRGILMPFSSDGETIDFIYGVINWKEMAGSTIMDALNEEVHAALSAAPAFAASPAPIWADGPSATADYEEEDDGAENASLNADTPVSDDGNFGFDMVEDDLDQAQEAGQDMLDLGTMQQLDAEKVDGDGAVFDLADMDGRNCLGQIVLDIPGEEHDRQEANSGSAEMGELPDHGLDELVSEGTRAEGAEGSDTLDLSAFMAPEEELTIADALGELDLPEAPEIEDTAASDDAAGSAEQAIGAGLDDLGLDELPAFEADALEPENAETGSAVPEMAEQDDTPEPEAVDALPEMDLSPELDADGLLDMVPVESEEQQQVVEAPALAEVAASDMPDIGDVLDPAESADGLTGVLDIARQSAAEAQEADARSRTALYRAIGHAYDFALASRDAPADYAAMLAEAGIAVQDRSPMTAVVKLVFGADYDKTRLAEYALALDYAFAENLPQGALGRQLGFYEGGLKGLVRDVRAARKAGEPAQGARRLERAYRKIAKATRLDGGALQFDEQGVALILARQEPDGSVSFVASVDTQDKAAQKVIISASKAI